MFPPGYFTTRYFSRPWFFPIIGAVASVRRVFVSTKTVLSRVTTLSVKQRVHAATFRLVTSALSTYERLASVVIGVVIRGVTTRNKTSAVTTNSVESVLVTKDTRSVKARR